MHNACVSLLSSKNSCAFGIYLIIGYKVLFDVKLTTFPNRYSTGPFSSVDHPWNPSSSTNTSI